MYVFLDYVGEGSFRGTSLNLLLLLKDMLSQLTWFKRNEHGEEKEKVDGGRKPWKAKKT
jgi:hypothetical protein